MRIPACCLAVFLSLVAALHAATFEPQGRDSKSLAAAIAQAKPGDTVQLPACTYSLSEPLRPKSGIKLIGAGQDKTTLVYEGNRPTSLVEFADCQDVELASLTVDGRNNPLVHQGISGGSSRRLWLHHLTIRNLKAKTWGPHGILFSGHNASMEGGVTDSRITDCTLENIGLEAEYGGGIRMAWGSVRNQVVGNTIRNTGRGGIFGDHAAELVIRRNRVSGSGGEGLGIEIWGGCPRSLIEDNVIDHWLSVDQGTQSAVRRNVIGAEDGSIKFLGIEIIACNVVVTDNVVNRGAEIGLSVSNRPVKNNVFWGYNKIRDCVLWGAQFQGESGGIAHHYFYNNVFENSVRGHVRARYPNDSGHGFRTNGECRQLVFEDCQFVNNGGYGIQFGGRGVDQITLLRSSIVGNKLTAATGPGDYKALELAQCNVEKNGDNRMPAAKPFATALPTAAFDVPAKIEAGRPAAFRCASQSAGGAIVERLWDFGHGIPEVSAAPSHTFEAPGKYRVTLIVWDSAGRGGRAEKTIEVTASNLGNRHE